MTATPLKDANETNAQQTDTRSVRHRSLRSLPLLTAGAVLVGGVAGWQLSGWDADDAPFAAATSSPSPSPDVPPFPQPDGALTVFDRPQDQADVPSAAVPAAFDMRSFRAVGAGVSGLNGEETTMMYGARSQSGLVCLIGVAATDTYVSTCAHVAQFHATGLRLYWPLRYHALPLDGSARPVVLDVQSTWLPDGTLEGGTAERSDF